MKGGYKVDTNKPSKYKNLGFTIKSEKYIF